MAVARTLGALILAMFVVAGCGGGGGSGGSKRPEPPVGGDPAAPGGTVDTQPTAQILFPPADAATEASRITVRGTASDDGAVTEVRVNGVLATTSDAFKTWQASVPLAPGANALTVEAVDGTANRNATAAEVMVARTALLPLPLYLDVDVPSSRLIVLDAQTRSLGAIDLSNGLRTLISSAPAAQDTNGIPFQGVFGMVVDSRNNRALVLDAVSGNGGRIVAVNLTTGARTIFSDPNTPNNTNPFQSARALALDVLRNRVLVVDNANTVISVSLTDGSRRVFSGPAIPDTVNPLNTAASIAVDAVKDRAIVFDGGLNPTPSQFIVIDLVTGARSVIPNSSGVGLSPVRMVVDGPRNRLLVTDGNGRVQAVSLDDGTAGSFVAGSRDPADLFFPGDIVIDAGRDRALVTNRRDLAGSLGEIVALDLASGSRTLLADPSRQSDLPFVSAVDVAYDAVNHRALVLDNVLNRIVALNVGQGAPRALIGNLSPRPLPVNFVLSGGPSGIALDRGNNRALVLGLMRSDMSGTALSGVTAVDLASGANEVLTSMTGGSFRGVAVDDTTRRAFILDTANPVSVSTASVSDPLVFTPSVVASGSPLMQPTRLVVDSTGRLLVTDLNRVLAIDPSGAVTELTRLNVANAALKGIVMDPSTGGAAGRRVDNSLHSSRELGQWRLCPHGIWQRAESFRTPGGHGPRYQEPLPVHR